MTKRIQASLFALLYIVPFTILQAATVVPNEVQLPGTQPGEVTLEDPGRCDNCHAGYNNATTSAAGEGDPEHEPSTGWMGAAMGNAGRDPIFWATMAIAEQDFDGSGDLCLRCHSTGGWYGGNSLPTDGSGLAASDDEGVDCDACHLMTNPDNSELTGVMNAPFIANDGAPAPDTEGFYGSGMLSLWGAGDKLGPYAENDAVARHQFLQSQFHRDVDFCGTCHDVSNSIVGDLAPGNGTQPGAPHAISSQDFNGGVPNLGGPVEEKAAFNNPPYAYGVVERTFSEYKASLFPTTRVSAFNTLPADLQTPGGSIDVTYQASLAAGQNGDYADGTPRFFSCQSCHMRPTTSKGANKADAPLRTDLPQHDHTGGNYWLADMIKYQDAQGDLRLGGGVSATQIAAIDLAQLRAVDHLTQAASLEVNADTLKVINLTGHKLISGYPEGRRMWLNIKWYDANSTMIREDGAYGPLVDDAGQPVLIANPAGGPDVQVESILDLDDPNTRIYEAHYSMTEDWADTLLAVGKPAGLALSYDRYTGAVDFTLGDLAVLPAGSHHETFHFALNNYVSSDNRIPPYGMNYDTAVIRNVVPVPATQYGGGTPGSTYNYWDEIDLNAAKPAGAVSADITLYYQGTTWEYIQFLEKANDGSNVFLGEEGEHMLEAWINAEVPVAIEVAGDRKMVPPVAMATTSWGSTVSGSILVENGAASTASLNVNLDLFAADAGNNVTQMRFSNDGISYSPWETYASQRGNWNLSGYGGDSTQGMKTVYVQFGNNAGTVQATFSDDIDYINPLAPIISGLWPGSGTQGSLISIFVFGGGFDATQGATTVYLNGVLQPLVAIVSEDMLIIRTTVDPSLYGPVTVTTPQGTAISETSFGVPASGLQLTGVWPSAVNNGATQSVFLFGSEFSTDATTEVYFNGIRQFLVAEVSSDMLVVRITANPTMSGPITVVTPGGSVASSEPFVVLP